ncbi:universal stress protein [Legionella dresdenensis]|uniref:Universal stress protein n=1 Tax=Legionella dresdenensis TaxID=450200 RepID=A0ABV8CBZ2_9GAMM
MFKTILHATDLSESHFNLCQQAARLAEDTGATLYLLHVIETPASLQIAQTLGFAELANPAKEDAETVMNVVGEALNIPSERLFVEIGSAYKHILNKIKELNCDLVVLGTQAVNHLPAFLGSTANAVIHQAPCSVLTLKIS